MSAGNINLAPSPVIYTASRPEAPRHPRIKKISISGYRAFPPYKPSSLEIDLGDAGNNLLLYGENGSGKTSLFRSLRDLFDTSPSERTYSGCQNIFLQSDEDAIAVTLTSGTPSEFRWEIGEPHPKQTGAEPFHLFARSCQFLDYKDLLQTNFIHRTGAPNLFELLVGGILTELPVPRRRLSELYEIMLRSAPKSPRTRKRVRRANTTASFLADALQNHLPELVREANRLLDALQRHTQIELKAPTAIEYSILERNYRGRTITLEVSLNGRAVTEPQHFLNEARLTAIALALYLAAARITRAGRPGILVLDDVLIGLDLSNRIPLLQLLQVEFADWQLMLLTYDRTWFELAREYTEHGGGWSYREMFLVEGTENSPGRPDIRDGVSPLRRAEAHLVANDLMAAAVYLRAAFESRIRNVCEDRGVEIAFKKQPKEVTANALWKGIVARQKKREELQIAEPHQKHPDFISRPLIQRVEMMRSTILNRLSHTDAPTFEKSEIETARDIVRELQDHSF